MRPRYVLALAAVVFASINCFGQGVVTPRRHRSDTARQTPLAGQPGEQQREDASTKPLPPALPVTAIRISVHADGQVATVRVEHVFRNDTNDLLEGTYYFPVPEGASLLEFAVYDGDERRVGRVKEKEEARAAYTAGVAQGEDPAILEMTRHGWFQSHVYPIPPHADKRIEVIYSQVLPAKGNVVTFDYALGQGYKKLKVPVGSVEIQVDLRSAIGITNVFSPTHPIDLAFDGDGHVTGKVSTLGGGEAENFQLVYSLSDSEFGMSLLTHRKEGEDGYFLLMLSPKVDFDERRVSSKDVVFVIDTSGSMVGDKIKQAREALRFGLTRTLNEEDRFNIVAFESSIKPMGGELVQATRANITRALDFVDKLHAAGGTNINDALVRAMKMFEPAPRSHLLVFITDGLPEGGVTDPGEIAANVRRANEVRARLFSFGVGTDVNRVLLERLAAENRGAGSFIADQSQLGQTVSAFFSKVSKPVLSDLHIDFGPVLVDRIHPGQLPDLYAKSQIKIYGRYRNAEDLRDVAISLGGQMNGQTAQFEFKGLNFPLSALDKESLPKLWASERVSALLEEIRVHGERPELKREVIELAREFNLVTPYTSMYVPTTGELARENASQPPRPAPGATPAGGAGRADPGSAARIAPPPGIVVDANGAVIPGARVTITDANTGATRTVTTDASGNYSVAGLPAGTYNVAVEAPGFSKTVINGVTVQSGQATSTGVSLDVGTASEMVLVTSMALAMTINSSMTQIGTVIDSRKVADLPTQHSIYSLALLAPGAAAQRQDDASRTAGGREDEPAPTLSLNGQRPRSNSFSLNSQDNGGLDGRPVISLSNLQAVQELNVTSMGPSDSAQGAGAAASIEVISRAGTNEFHGSAFDYYLNRRLGTLSPIERRDGLDRPPAFRNNVYGGTFGGPIQRDRIFFFGSFQGETETARRLADSTAARLTPTLAGLNELSRTFPASLTIRDLMTRGPLGARAGSVSVARTFSLPVFGNPIEFGQIARLLPAEARGYEGGARFDFQLTNSDSVSTSYWYDGRRSENDAGRLAAGYADDTASRGQLWTASWVHVSSPTTVNEFGLGVTRSRLSLGKPMLSSDVGAAMPAVNVGLRGLSYGTSPFIPAQTVAAVFRANDTWTHVIGRHNIRVGGHLLRRLIEFDYLPGARGQFTYASFEDFVLDRPAAIAVAVGDPRSRFTQTEQRYFAGDSWRWRSDLTLTFGVSYSLSGQPINQLVDRLNTREASSSSALFDPSLPLELRTIPRVARDSNNFAPRLGFAYTPRFRPFGRNLFGNEMTVIRGGVNVSYDQTAYSPLADAASSAPAVLSAVLTPALGSGVGRFPNPPTADELNSMLGRDPRKFARAAFTRDFRSPYAIGWHLSVGREVLRRLDVEASYAGVRAIGLMRVLDVSSAAASPGSAAPFSGPSRVYASTGRSMYHSLQTRADLRIGGDLTAGAAYTFSKMIDDVPDIGAGVIGGIADPAAPDASALQSFAQNPRDVSTGERGLSSMDRRHALSAHFLWRLPSPRHRSGVIGRLFGGWQASGIVNAASGSPYTPMQYFGYSGRLHSSIFSDRLGSVRPFAGNAHAPADSVAFSNAANAYYNFFASPDGTRFVSPTGFIIADRSGFRAGMPSDARLLYNDYAVELAARAMGLAPDAFGQTIAAGRPFGDVGRNTLMGPALSSIDFALIKTMKLSEKVSLQLRVEAFNLPNHPSRAKPSNVLEHAGGFGFADLGETDSSPRRVRLGLKLTF